MMLHEVHQVQNKSQKNIKKQLIILLCWMISGKWYQYVQYEDTVYIKAIHYRHIAIFVIFSTYLYLFAVMCNYFHS